MADGIAVAGVRAVKTSVRVTSAGFRRLLSVQPNCCGSTDAARWGVFVGPPQPGVFGYPDDVSPTVLRVRGFRFYFFSREEPRMHVHVHHANGEAKFWLEPTVELCATYGLNAPRVNEAAKLIEEHLDEIRRAWGEHFPG